MPETPPPPSVVEAKAAYEAAQAVTFEHLASGPTQTPGLASWRRACEIWQDEAFAAHEYVILLEQTLATERAERDFPRKYLPLDCPNCDRRRLLASVRLSNGEAFVPVGAVECEKCGWTDSLASSPEGAT